MFSTPKCHHITPQRAFKSVISTCRFGLFEDSHQKLSFASSLNYMDMSPIGYTVYTE